MAFISPDNSFCVQSLCMFPLPRLFILIIWIFALVNFLGFAHDGDCHQEASVAKTTCSRTVALASPSFWTPYSPSCWPQADCENPEWPSLQGPFADRPYQSSYECHDPTRQGIVEVFPLPENQQVQRQLLPQVQPTLAGSNRSAVRRSKEFSAQVSAKTGLFLCSGPVLQRTLGLSTMGEIAEEENTISEAKISKPAESTEPRTWWKRQRSMGSIPWERQGSSLGGRRWQPVPVSTCCAQSLLMDANDADGSFNSCPSTTAASCSYDRPRQNEGVVLPPRQKTRPAHAR